MNQAIPVTIYHALMTAAEAKRCCDRIRNHLEDARSSLLELRQREGWRALKYATWLDCVMAEFGLSKSRAYQLLQAAEIEAELDTRSTRVEKSQIPEGVLRPLATLDSPLERQEVWDAAIDETGGGLPTGSRIAELVALVQSNGDQEEIAELIEEEEAETLAVAEETQEEENATRRANDLKRALERARQSYRILGRYGGSFTSEATTLKQVVTSLAKKLETERVST